MKKLLLVILIVGFAAMVNAQKRPYNNLIFSEVRMSMADLNYCEITNMGTETIDLSEFKLGSIGPWTKPWLYEADVNFQLPRVQLAPGKSYVLATSHGEQTKNWLMDPKKFIERRHNVELLKLADYVFDMPESKTAGDIITPKYRTMDVSQGWYCWYLKHIYEIDGVKDSMIIDQVGGIFDEVDGTNSQKAIDVAGVKNATNNCILVRKASVNKGIVEFSTREANEEAAKMQFINTKGIDIADSEWIPIPNLGGVWDYWRSALWTVGNHGDYKLDATTLVSKVAGKINVDFDKATITVPWGVRYNDSIMAMMVKKPGIAWHYDFAPTTEDSTYTSARTGDKLTIYACGNEPMNKVFSIVVSAPDASANIVMSRTMPELVYRNNARTREYFRITDGVAGIDTISNITFALRVDTLYKYLEKAPKASWKIIPQDGIAKLELRNGDKLQVTAENGSVKEYYLKLQKFLPKEISELTSITWPDIPDYFKGEIAAFYGWKGDTIPGFAPGNKSYVVNIPLEYNGIPALVFTKSDPNSKVVVARAKSLDGTLEESTATFTVTAEDGITNSVYTVRFNKEKDASKIQKWQAEPYISEIQFSDKWSYPWMELANPGTEPIDLSHYMIMAGYGDYPNTFGMFNYTTDFALRAYMKYVPGKKWQDEANWLIQPRILEQDLATNSRLEAGDVFVMAAVNLGGTTLHPRESVIDFNFMKTPWGVNYGKDRTAIGAGGVYKLCMYLVKILNDSVVNGLKPALDIRDFELIDMVGGANNANWVVGGTTINTWCNLTRKPNVYKGKTEINGSFGTNADDSEWVYNNGNRDRQLDGMGSQVINPVTVYKSTVTSKVYKVSLGYGFKETIRGVTDGTIVSGFNSNILKANELQTLKVKSATTGAELTDADAIHNGDTLIVQSADKLNITKYILDVSVNGLSSDALLKSTNYTINATGSIGSIAGFPKNTLLKTVLAGVMVPERASLSIIDKNDAYVSLTKLNYDTVYVDVLATDNIYFEVIAENGTTKITYQLNPTSNADEAYITSDVFSVDQFASLIQFVPSGTTITSLLSNVVASPGATVAVYDKTGFVREIGDIYKDDKLVVTSTNGTTKVYYISMLNYNVNTYFAYVVSDDYQIDQVEYVITGPATPIISEFFAKLYPSLGATLSVIDKNGNTNTSTTFNKGDRLLVTAADGSTTAVYTISVITKAIDTEELATIKIYPNPTTDKVIVNGLSNGNRVRVFNAAGIALRDVIVDNSTDYVSLSAQPAGIYMFIISSGDKLINVQKIIKK
ncbi:MAG TPA: T9SS type A sorting domain-containing protein [Prolixibacteraceae bacterium]|nr:T9SS type A sorting domain-containing protein [Prolixibacteraceae bacterium]